MHHVHEVRSLSVPAAGLPLSCLEPSGIESVGVEIRLKAQGLNGLNIKLFLPIEIWNFVFSGISTSKVGFESRSKCIEV